jgi:CheY-like chemotaxis protein
MQGLLSFDGHSVETVRDAESALEKLATQHFDIVFTDLRMPSMSGDALAIAIKKQYPQKIVVLLTGSAEQHNQKPGEQASIDFTLYKPFHLHELREIIQAITVRQAEEALGPAELVG